MDPFRGRVAVVTGGGGGIGAELARAFAARGSKIVLADVDEAAMAKVEAELAAGGAAVCSIHTDVSKRERVEALAEAAVQRFGSVHIVCNNAGIATFGEIVKSPHEDWEFTMGVNFWGVVHGVECFVPRLLAQGEGGHVVNTASMAGLVGMRWLGVYCASKFAVVGLTEALHRELEPHGIGVSVLCPMIVETSINENSVRLRPAHLRSQAPPPAPPPTGAMKGGIVSAVSVAKRVVRAIEERRLYVLTHPEQREILRRRAARLEAAFEDLAG
jgi:NAD(P)-dependent dehydrogenase (short-subunit alcohol dehydrogenase family)